MARVSLTAHLNVMKTGTSPGITLSLRWRLHMGRQRTGVKNRIHAALLAFGHPCRVSALFGAAGRRQLADFMERGLNVHVR